MHSRIFQISEEPVVKDDYIDDCEFYDHWFTNEVADYVAEGNRESDIEWLKSCLQGCEVKSDEHGVYLVVLDKEEYFKKTFEEFKKHLDNIKNCTITEFANGTCDHEIWCLKECYSDRFGFYVYTDDPMTFDDFIRMAKANRKYYIGGTVDYHF